MPARESINTPSSWRRVDGVWPWFRTRRENLIYALVDAVAQKPGQVLFARHAAVSIRIVLVHNFERRGVAPAHGCLVLLLGQPFLVRLSARLVATRCRSTLRGVRRVPLLRRAGGMRALRELCPGEQPARYSKSKLSRPRCADEFAPPQRCPGVPSTALWVLWTDAS